MRGAFLSTAPALARFPFNCALLERIDHRAPGHVYRGLLCREGLALLGEGRAAKSCHPPPPKCQDQHYHRAFGQQPEDDRESLPLVVVRLEEACLEVCRVHAQKGNTRR